MVWTHEETRPRIHRKKDYRLHHLGEEPEEDQSRYGWTVNRDMSAVMTIECEVRDRTGWRRIVSASVRTHNTIKWERLE